MIENKSDAKIMQALVNSWYDEFTIDALSKESKLTRPSTYGALEKLEKINVIEKENGRIRINKTNIFAYRFKLLNDADRFLQLDEKTQSTIANIYTTFKVANGNNLSSFIVIGSTASLEKTESSDIDFLVILKKKKEISYESIVKQGNINIIEKTEEEFEKDYLKADDFIISSLIMNLIIYDDGFFKIFLERPFPEPTAEIISIRKEKLYKRSKRLRNLLKEGDHEELIKEYRDYLIQKGRIILLERGIIPLSKQNVLNEIKKIDKKLYKRYFNANRQNIKKMVLIDE